MKLNVKIAALAVTGALGLSLLGAACGGGSGSSGQWYANGRAYALAADNAGETSSIAETSAGDFCWYTYEDTAGPKDDYGIALHAPPGTDAASGAGAQWVAGCNSDPTAYNAGVGGGG